MLVTAINIQAPSLIHAHSGDVLLSAPLEIHPVIDGTIRANEWADAYSSSLTTSSGRAFKLYLKNSASFLYVAIDFIGDKDPAKTWVDMYFDVDHDGAPSAHLDIIYVVNGEWNHVDRFDGTYWPLLCQIDGEPFCIDTRLAKSAGTSPPSDLVHSMFEFWIAIGQAVDEGIRAEAGQVVGFLIGFASVVSSDQPSENLGTYPANFPRDATYTYNLQFYADLKLAEATTTIQAAQTTTSNATSESKYTPVETATLQTTSTSPPFGQAVADFFRDFARELVITILATASISVVSSTLYRRHRRSRTHST